MGTFKGRPKLEARKRTGPLIIDKFVRLDAQQLHPGAQTKAERRVNNKLANITTIGLWMAAIVG